MSGDRTRDPLCAEKPGIYNKSYSQLSLCVKSEITFPLLLLQYLVSVLAIPIFNIAKMVFSLNISGDKMAKTVPHENEA